jgi:AraC-like DNA-binding protein
MTQELIEALTRYTDIQKGSSPFSTAIEGVIIMRSDHESYPHHRISKPSLCIVVQGSKWTTLGGRRFDYQAGQALVVSVNMPALGRIVQASPTEPFLGLVIEFDFAALRAVLEELDELPAPKGERGKSVFITDFDGPLADCALRLVRLLDSPKAIPMLYPSIMREICYWLLTGPHGGEIYKVALAGGSVQQIVESIRVLRNRFTEPIRVAELARVANMSPSAFHQRFKALMGTTPLQYQKQMRLLEARNLLVSSEINVETAAFQVGYESPSQFSREYARMFGTSPRKDVMSQV